MKNYRIYLLASVTTIAISHNVGASDLTKSQIQLNKLIQSVQSPWDGFYVGVQGGQAFRSDLASTQQSITTDGRLVGLPAGTFTPPVTYGGADSNGSMNGWLGGGHIGYNIQFNNWVMGIETALLAADFKNASMFSGSALGPQYTTKSALDILGTTHVRIGYAIGDLLPYVLGGVAYAHTKSSVTIQPGAIGAPIGGALYASTDGWQAGYVVGAGLEFLITPRMVARGEYKHVGLGNKEYTFTYDARNSARAVAKQDYDIVTAGISYKF